MKLTVVTQEQPVLNTKLISPTSIPFISEEDLIEFPSNRSIEDNYPLICNEPIRKPKSTSTLLLSDGPVVTVLKTMGLYKKSCGAGKHEITCPWVNDHTDNKDSGTVYFEPSETFYTGGFKCRHTHCKRRTLKDLLAYLEISFSEVIAGAK